MHAQHNVHPYASKRSQVFAKNGVVATSQPLAAQVGLRILQSGGNAIDAAIATAAALTVVEPTGCGIGGDAFAIISVNNQLHGLNASGPAPQLLTLSAMQAKGYDKIPLYGFDPVTVPGIPAAWAALSKRFGRLPFAEVLAPAIELAEQGFPVSPITAELWQRAYITFTEKLSSEHLKHWLSTFCPQGRGLLAGELFCAPDHAKTLTSLAKTQCESFYRGELAAQIDAHSKALGGYLRAEDLAAYQVEWVDPICTHYRGYDIWEIPPNGQGMVALMALNILQGFEFSERETLNSYHRQIEAMKLAYADGQAYITQADEMPYSVDALLSNDYAEKRRAQINEKALTPTAGKPQAGGTVYLATADNEGNMVSFIQSNYHGFGSGVVIPDTGIALQNRGHDFALDENHPNVLRPGKKTYHTIIPGFISKAGQAIGPFGVMGGYMQPQGHAQVIMNMIDFGMNPQEALDAPRWQWLGGKKVGLEQAVSPSICKALQERGHEVQIDCNSISYGRGQIILRDSETGVYSAGTEPRADGQVAAY